MEYIKCFIGTNELYSANKKNSSFYKVTLTYDIRPKLLFVNQKIEKKSYRVHLCTWKEGRN